MKTPNKNTILNVQKTIIGFCALATVGSLAVAEIGYCKQNNRAYVAGTLGSLFTTAGLGLAVGGYLSNPYRKKERD